MKLTHTTSLLTSVFPKPLAVVVFSISDTICHSLLLQTPVPYLLKLFPWFFFFLSAHLSHLPQILSVPWGFLPQFSFNPLLCSISEYFILVTSAIICMWAVPEWYTFYLDLFFFTFLVQMPISLLNSYTWMSHECPRLNSHTDLSCPPAPPPPLPSPKLLTSEKGFACRGSSQSRTRIHTHLLLPPHPISLPTWLSSSTLLWSPLFLSVPLVIAYGALHFTLMFSWPEPPCPPCCILHGTA